MATTNPTTAIHSNQLLRLLDQHIDNLRNNDLLSTTAEVTRAQLINLLQESSNEFDVEFTTEKINDIDYLLQDLRPTLFNILNIESDQESSTIENLVNDLELDSPPPETIVPPTIKQTDDLTTDTRLDHLKELLKEQRAHQQNIVNLHHQALESFRQSYLQEYGSIAGANKMLASIEPQLHYAVAKAIENGASNPYDIVHQAQTYLEIQNLANASQINQGLAARATQELEAKVVSKLEQVVKSSPKLTQTLKSQDIYQSNKQKIASAVTQGISVHITQIQHTLTQTQTPKQEINSSLEHLKTAARHLNPPANVVEKLQTHPITQLDIAVLENLNTPQAQAVVAVLKADPNPHRTLNQQEFNALISATDQQNELTQAVLILEEVVNTSPEPAQIAASLKHVQEIALKSSLENTLTNKYLEKNTSFNQAQVFAKQDVGLALTHHKLSAAPMTQAEMQLWLKDVGIDGQSQLELQIFVDYLEIVDSPNILPTPNPKASQLIFQVTQGNQDQIDQLIHQLHTTLIDHPNQNASRFIELISNPQTNFHTLIQSFNNSGIDLTPHLTPETFEWITAQIRSNPEFSFSNPSQAFSQIVRIFTNPSTEGVGTAFGQLGLDTQGISGIFSHLPSSGGKLGGFFSKLGGFFKNGAQSLIPKLGGAIRGLGGAITGFGSMIQSAGAAALTNPYIIGGIIIIFVVVVFIVAIIQGTSDASDQIATAMGGPGFNTGNLLPICDPNIPPEEQGECIDAFCDPSKRDCSWPMSCGCIVQGPGGTFSHNGSNSIDFMAEDPYCVTQSQREVTAIAAGKVEVVSEEYSIGNGDSYGNYVKINDAQGNYFIYSHLQPGINVSVGQDVIKGQLIGIANDTGFSTGTHLHLEYSGTQSILSFLPLSQEQATQIYGCSTEAGAAKECPSPRICI